MLVALLAMPILSLMAMSMMGPYRTRRWERPGVFAPASQFTPERLADLCLWSRPHMYVYAPDDAFTPERLHDLRQPTPFYRAVCAPDSAFTPERLASLKDPVWSAMLIYAPDGREFEAPLFPPDVFCPDCRNLARDALLNVCATERS
jgi:hypothetical protein